ncbi:MAG: hypothetical protein KAT79_02775 [candidate division Zixibacteria bacterium]|nr:hypothetical protein [candidate division Zixibacteria bacterium]
MEKAKKIQLTAMLIAIFLISASSHAKVSFKIEDYIPEKFVDLKWRLGGNLRLNGSDQDSESIPTTESEWRIDRSESNRDGTDFSAGTDFGYRYETIPKFLRYTASLNISYSDDTFEGNSQREDSLGGLFYSSSDQDGHTWRMSASENLEAGAYISGDQFVSAIWSGNAIYYSKPEQTSHSLNIDEYTSGGFHYYNLRNRNRERDQSTRQYYSRLELRTGHGRVYEGLYAAAAAYMIDELKKTGALTGAPNRDQMLKLCDLIYEYKLKHAVDKRLLKIEALGEIYEYLNSIGATDDGHAGYLAVQDVWDFFPRNPRRFGTVLSGGIGWEFNYYKQTNDNSDSDTRLSWNYDINNPSVVDTISDTTYQSSTSMVNRTQTENVFLGGRFEHYRPVNIRWQWDVVGEMAYYLHAEHISGTSMARFTRRAYIGPPPVEKRDIDDYYRIQAVSTLTYIYSSRTSCEFYGGISYDNYSTRPWGSDERWWSSNRLAMAIDGQLTYRISIPTTLRANISYNYRKDKNETTDMYENASSFWTLGTYISHYLF